MSRRLWILLSVLALALAVVAPIGAAGAAQDGSAGLIDVDKVVEESPTGSYIVVMTADPLVVTEGSDNLDTSAARRQADELEESHDQALEDAGIAASDKVQDYTNAVNGFSAIVSHEEAEKLAALPEVALVLPDELRQIETDSSPDYLGLDGRHEAWQTGLDGSGVVVGIIDTGIWPEHPSFADDGSYPEPPVTVDACDFGNTDHNPNDAPFECNNKLIGARQMLDTYRALIGAEDEEFDSARDDSGHGTHTASTTAGNAGVEATVLGNEVGTISGIAPRAHVVAYKALGDLGGFTSDLMSAIDQAVYDGVDVINYSIGGGASLISGDDISFLYAADAGVFVATSAGNSGPGSGTVGGPGTVPWITTVGANTQPRFFEGEITLGNAKDNQARPRWPHFSWWGFGGWWSGWWWPPHPPADDGIIGASITNGTDELPLVDAEFAGGDLCLEGTLDPAVVSGAIVLCRRGANARVGKSLAVAEAGGAGMILYNNDDTDNLYSDTHHVPSVHVDYTEGIEIKEYIATDDAPTAKITTGDVGVWESAPSMTGFSSRGPNSVAGDIIKPDVTAPGLQILAGGSPFVDAGEVTGELFQAIAGTSMSSPHVAGLFALLKQAHPDWSAAMARSALMTTADQDVVDNDRVSQADPFAMGSGQVDPGRPSKKGSSFQPGLVYDAGYYEYLGFLCDAEPSVFGDPTGTCAWLEENGIPTDASDLNYPSIGVAELAGSQTVTRTVTSVAEESYPRRYWAQVDAPDGFDVVVSPSSFSLSSGESATYEVTITNNGGGDIGEWAFGSLTWRSGKYLVYSPIAVNAALFDAPDELTLAGADGAVTFDVSFGYTGDYAASAHGLEAAIVENRDVVQDPDSTFDPTDGYSQLHEFDLSGDAFFRIAIPEGATDDPDADLDVFVYDPTGEQVASSTKGGTDEQVDILSPMDGIWQVYVHGWAAPGDGTNYDLSAWIISATPGGSLTLDSAPTSATLATSEPIEISWSGLAAATQYLGAVAHTGPDGLMGLTLVGVTTE